MKSRPSLIDKDGDEVLKDCISSYITEIKTQTLLPTNMSDIDYSALIAQVNAEAPIDRDYAKSTQKWMKDMKNFWVRLVIMFYSREDANNNLGSVSRSSSKTLMKCCKC